MTLFESDNPKQFIPVILEHFKYLADTPKYYSVLENLMQHAKSVTKEHENAWVILFRDGEEWERITLTCGKALSDNEVKNLPEFHRSLISPYGYIRIDVGYDVCELNEGRNYDSDPEWGNVPKAFRSHLDNLLAPISDGNCSIFYHPYKCNKQGLPLLCFTSSKTIEKQYTINAGAYILKWVAEEFNIKVPE